MYNISLVRKVGHLTLINVGRTDIFCYFCDMKCNRLIFGALMVLVWPVASYSASPREVAESGMAGYELFMRDSLPDDRQRGYDLMLSAAWEGDAKAANNIGWLMQHGEFVGKDIKGAFRWYERAVDQGLPAAALNYVELILNHQDSVLDGRLPDRERMAKASMLAGTALAMGRGLHYDPKRGEDLILRAALFGDPQAMTTVAQQLEMYPDSFSYLPLEKIAAQCDALLAPEERNVPDGMPLTEFADLMLIPTFWYDHAEKRSGASTKREF